MYSYLSKKSGNFAAIGCTNLLGFINTDDKNASSPNIEYLHLCLPKQMIGLVSFLQLFAHDDNIVQQLSKINKVAPIFSLSVILLKSRGTIKLRSRSIYDNPIINLNFFDDDDDLLTLVKGIREYRKLLNTTSFKTFEITESRINFPECNSFVFDSDNY